MSEPAIASPTLRTECFIYQLVPGQGPVYDEYHANVWPEVLQSLNASGITDYSIYRRGDLLISVRTRDIAAPEPELSPETRQRVQEWDVLMETLLVAYQDEQGQPLFATRVFRL
jgi:L-rhamnose mutarotase